MKGLRILQSRARNGIKIAMALAQVLNNSSPSATLGRRRGSYRHNNSVKHHFWIWQ